MALETITLVQVSLSADIVASDGPLSALQQCLVKRLQQESHYAPFQLLYENKLDIISEIDLAIASMGLTVIIMTPSFQDNTPNIPIIQLDEVEIVAQVIESPLINRASTGSGILGGLVAWWLASDLKRTFIDGSQVTVRSMKQFVNESEGTVLWNVTCKLSPNA